MQIIEDAELIKNLFIMMHQAHTDQQLIAEVLVDLIALFDHLACLPCVIDLYLRPFQESVSFILRPVRIKYINLFSQTPLS